MVCVLLLIFYSFELKESYHVVQCLMSGLRCGTVVETEIIINDSHKYSITLLMISHIRLLFCWTLRSNLIINSHEYYLWYVEN